MNRFVAAEHLDIGGYSDVGQREQNEDTYLIDRELGLVIVADGIGGHQCGEVASAITCAVIQREIAAGATLATAITRANNEVINAVHSGSGKPGMGSTVIAVLLTPGGYELAWVGDSRIYLWDGKLSLLTRDHSLVQSQLASGQISMEEARTHPHRHVILQAVGSQAAGQLEIGTNAGRLSPNSCLLLCSDGITDPLDSAQLCQVLRCSATADETCERLVTMALQCGGKDNATALLIAYRGVANDPPQPMAPDQVVWVYDPATSTYAGLPDRTVRHVDYKVEIERSPVQHSKPTPARPLLSPARAVTGESDTDRRSATWRFFWLTTLLGTLAVAVVWSVF